MADRIGYNGNDRWKGKATELLNELFNGSGGGGSGSDVVVHTTEEWQQLTSLISVKGTIYVWSDYKMEHGEPIPALKIGDGLAYVVDLPFATQAITLQQINSWNNKVSIRVSGDTLIFEN